MEVQFGDKLKPPSSLWHMIKICFVLLICYSQIPRCCWHCKLRLHACPWITVQLFLLFFLLISTEPRKCHLHLVEKLHLQTLETKCVIQGPPPTTTPPPCQGAPQQKCIPLEVWEHKRWSFPWQGSSGDEVFFLLLTPEISLLFCLSLQNKESLTRT